ncbi:unnamed protein product (macronuclear) [Paramecium tetraurelia]|uniref:UBC core domain-containing protein n=1 Tax=Paramecium tetraurelia TaxID=5888 RepID=A0BYP0_PARTE|nr:uncharacterized protein GSPATT00033510001 [Paramecium tetraurelia]CAK63657.1 unnamed protein product [Paramecium tetraurelia]|eukprot:XP_001431055.1 hypothetical protein (macronuclear) [Paramecium tetraurelia strain d4-2]
MQFEYFIDQRIANQVEQLKRRKDKATSQDQNTKQDDDEDDFDGYVPFTDIEHLQEYKQVRVGFEGKYLSEWKGALYYFVIKYNNYPISPVRIEFPKEFRHQYIIQNTGVYCHPDWSEKYWKKSMTLDQIINRVISTFHEIPTYSDYPVDLSFVQLSLNKDEYQQVIKENKNYATNYTMKINEERSYYEQKRKQNELIKQKKEQEKKEYEKKEQEKKAQEKKAQEKEKELKQKTSEEHQKIQQQQQDYQQQINNKNQNQMPQQYDQNQLINNRIVGNQVPHQPINQMHTQPQLIQDQQRVNQGANQYFQQQPSNTQSFNSGQLNYEQNMQNKSFPGYNQNMQNQQFINNQQNFFYNQQNQNAQNQQIQPQQQQQMPQANNMHFQNQHQPQMQVGKIKILNHDQEKNQ